MAYVNDYDVLVLTDEDEIDDAYEENDRKKREEDEDEDLPKPGGGPEIDPITGEPTVPMKVFVG